jgi:hypothetical protein
LSFIFTQTKIQAAHTPRVVSPPSNPTQSHTQPPPPPHLSLSLSLTSELSLG